MITKANAILVMWGRSGAQETPMRPGGETASPPALVSPLTPAFTTVQSRPSERILSCRTDGHASGRSTPYPAERLSPRTTSVLDAGGMGAAA